MHRVLLAAMLGHIRNVVRYQTGLDASDILKSGVKIRAFRKKRRDHFRQATRHQIEFGSLPT
jgi:hypothetical protein